MEDLYYQISGTGKTIAFVQGFMEHSAMWKDYQVLSSDFQILLVDLFGHGQSEYKKDEPISMESMAEQINSILVKENIDEIVLIGHSMGGYVGLAFAELFPEKLSGLGLFFSTPFADSEQKKEQRLNAIKTVTAYHERFVQLSIPTLFNQRNLVNLKDEIALAKRWAMQTSLKGIVGCLNGMRVRPNRLNIFKNLNKPCFVLLGRFDNAVNSDEVKSSLENSEHILIKELPVGHMGHLEAPKECFEFVNNYLTQNLGLKQYK